MPELPAILRDGEAGEEATELAGDAIRLYWETMRAEVAPGAMVRETAVELAG